MGYSSTHQWANGAITTVERVGESELNIRVQDEKENMLADFVIGYYEVMCLIHSITSVMTRPDDVEIEVKP